MAEDEDDLETFEVTEFPEAIAARRENEGTNTSRFALLGLMGGQNNGALYGLDRELLQLGFSPELLQGELSFGDQARRSDDRVASLRYLGEMSSLWNRSSENLDDYRNRAWRDVNNIHLESRIGLLTAGLCSRLERESIVAAISLIGNLKVAHAGNPWRSDDIAQFWKDSYDASVNRQIWPYFLWPYAGFAEGREIDDQETEPFTTREWNASAWATMTHSLVQRALERFGGRKALLHVLTDIAWMRVGFAQRSQDAIVEQFPQALFMRLNRAGPRLLNTSGGPSQYAWWGTAHAPTTLVHGTFARYSLRNRSWWKSDSDFGDYVVNNYRSCLYKGLSPFSWSGQYSDGERLRAARVFKSWADGLYRGEPLCTVFAHSCGTEVVARAINGGARVKDLVLLSSPVNQHILDAIPRVRNLYDVRTSLDLVLVAASVAQRFAWIVERQSFGRHHISGQHISDLKYWGHGVTHQRKFWENEKVAAALHL